MVEFLTMAKETLVHVMSFMSYSDMIRLTESSKTMRRYLSQPVFWFDPYRENQLPRLNEPVTLEVFLREYQKKGNALIQEINYFINHRSDIYHHFEGHPQFRKIHMMVNMLKNKVDLIRSYDAKLPEINLIVNKLNDLLLTLQMPDHRSTVVELKYISRLTSEWIDQYCLKHEQTEDNLNITYLDLKNTGITKLPDNIGRLFCLESINLYGTQLTELPETIKNLKKLRIVLASGGHMTEFPEILLACPSLETICLINMGIENIPENIHTLQHLNILWLMDNNISKIPENMYRLGDMHELHLENNYLSPQQPESFYQWLRYLKIDANQLLVSQAVKINQENHIEDISQNLEALTLADHCMLQQFERSRDARQLRLVERNTDENKTLERRANYGA